MTIHVKRKEVDGGIERRFLTAAIVSDRFLQEASSFYDPDLVETRYVRTVAEWCFHYYAKYKKAPGLHIKDIYESHADRMEQIDRELIISLLENLSNEYERSDKLNVPYLLDQAEKHFKSLSLTQLGRSVTRLAAEGELENAESELSDYKRVGRPSSLGSNPFKDAEAVQKSFEQAEHPLLELPGPLGRMMNPVLNRDQFVSFMGPEKRGKTWWLNEIAIRAAKARCNVALFQIGDMSEEQVIVRLSIRLAGKSNQARYCGEQDVPILDCRWNQDGSCKKCPHNNAPIFKQWDLKEVQQKFKSKQFTQHLPCTDCAAEKFFKGSIWYEHVHVGKPLTWREAWKAGNRLLGRIKGKDFILSIHPSDKLTASDIKVMLDNWEAFDDFIPDAVIIDYADNLAPEDRREEYRHQQNRTWKLLRGLSQEKHCLVVTATQASAASYYSQTLAMKHFSEDKRKYAHVTGMFGLNQTTEEKRAGLMRINTIVIREGEFYVDDEVHVAQALRIGRPLLFSF